MNHDQQGRDLRLHRQVAGNEDDRAVLAHPAREREGEARQECGQHGGEDDAAEDVETSGAKCLCSVFEVTLHFEQRRLHGSYDEWHAYQGQCDRDTDPGVGHFDTQRLQVLSYPAVLRENRCQCDARHRGWQRKGHVDERVNELAAGELVADQRPGDDEAEHQVDGGGKETCAK